MGRLDNSEFLCKLESILKANDGKSSVYMTQKRLSSSLPLDSSESGINDLSSNVIDNEEFTKNYTKYPVLIRLSMNGETKSEKKNKKLSTVVEYGNLDQFWTDYVQIIKTGFTGLKKKEKKKSKKSVRVSK